MTADTPESANEGTTNAALVSRLDEPTQNVRDTIPLPLTDEEVVQKSVSIRRANKHVVVPSTITESNRVINIQRVTTAEMRECLSVLNVRKGLKFAKELKNAPLQLSWYILRLKQGTYRQRKIAARGVKSP